MFVHTHKTKMKISREMHIYNYGHTEMHTLNYGHRNTCNYLHQKHMHSILDTELHKITDLGSNTHRHI